MGKRNVNFDIWWPERPGSWGVLRRYLMPHPGTLIMTLLLVGGLLWAGSVGAIPLRAPAAATTSTGTIAYQGRLADSGGTPITDTVNMEFRLYDVAEGGAPLWNELWTGSNAVRVSDGLFNVMLGSLEPIPQDVVAGHDQLWLGITVGTDDEMSPRVQLGSVPFAVQALTVPDGSVTTAKIADRAVTSAKLNVDNGLSVKKTLEVRGNGDLYFHRDDGNTTASIVLDGPGAGTDKLAIQQTGGGTIQRFSVNANVAAIQTGNVGIGTTNPSEKLHVIGNILASGSKSAVVNTVHYGQRKLYAAESPEVRFFDEGLAYLKDGSAHVTLDPVFLETIETDYLVHVTPYRNASLYVSEIGEGYFVVKARNGDYSAPFAWRLSARRKGYDGIRLETVTQDNVDGVQ